MEGQSIEIRRYPDKGIIESHIGGNAFFSPVQAVSHREDYDYFDLGANLELPNVPSSFVGVSGGGLWDVKLVMTKSKGIAWDGKRHFRGVAFWETKESENHLTIRCHGPRSIFEKAWESWALTA